MYTYIHIYINKHNSFSDDALQSLHNDKKEASSRIGALARTAKLAESDSSRSISESEPKPQQAQARGKFSLAPEHGTNTYSAAQEFGGMLQHMQEERDDRIRADKQGYKAYFKDEPKQQQQQQQVSREKSPARAVEKESFDSFGIPEGDGEGFHVTKYKSAVAEKKAERRTEGITSDQANSDIDQYFTKLGTYLHIYIHVYTYIYMYIYTYIYTYTYM